MQPPPLAGRRIVEIGTMVAAPFAAHILAQLGAEVIKVEPPSGDPTRALVRGGPGGTFIAYSHGKQSVCLDLSRPEGRAALYQLLATADALVHNLAPRAARKLGLTREDCAAVNPRLIYCHIRGYGAGPQEDELMSNPVAEAATGVMESNRIDGRPCRLGPSYHDQFAGAYAVIGLLASMLQAQAGGQPEPVEVGLYETGLHVAARDLAGMQLKTHLFGKPEREPHGEFSNPGYGAYQTSDGRWIYVLMLADTHWRRFCEALALPQAHDASLATLRQRRKAREQVEGIVKAAVAAHTYEDITRRLQAAGVGATEVLPIERVLEAPQAQAPGKTRHIEFRGLGFDVPEFPRRNAGRDGIDTLAPAELGAHTDAVLAAAGVNAAARAALYASGAALSGATATFPWAPVKR